ncbi:MAG: DUF5752 family protein [Terriglobales bacterium]
MATSSLTTPVAEKKPPKPFYFNTSAHLLRITEYAASTLSELLDGLRKCPEDSVFQHTFRTLQEHHFLREGFSNDFAHWALASCNEPKLAEALASVDVREFTSVAGLRERLIETLENALADDPRAGGKIAEEKFYFCASDIVVIPTTFKAETIHEFAEGLRRVSLHSIHHHFIEARLRLKLMSNDFSQWLYEDLGLTEAAQSLNRIDIYTATLEGVRRQIVRVVERALT